MFAWAPVDLEEVTLLHLLVAPVDLEEVICVCMFVPCIVCLHAEGCVHTYVWMYVGDYVENWVNHKMDAASAAIAKVVVVHVLQTCLCMYVLFKPPAHSIHDFVNLGETCCDEAGAQRGPERPDKPTCSSAWL